MGPYTAHDSMVAPNRVQVEERRGGGGGRRTERGECNKRKRGGKQVEEWEEKGFEKRRENVKRDGLHLFLFPEAL